MTAPYYTDGTVSLWHGDCRELLPELPPAAIIATDPPYASAAATATTGWAKQKWGGNWGDMSLVTMMAQATLDAANLTPEHEVYWFADHLSYAALVPVFFRRYPLLQSVIWDRDALGMGAYYRRQTEFIIYGRTRNAAEFTSRTARDLIRMKADYANREHPAQKPVGLMVELLANSGPGTVLDPYAGSGTTLLAARMLGRSAVGVEIEERYCELIAKRLQQDRADMAGAEKPAVQMTGQLDLLALTSPAQAGPTT
jgi:site-specific DNA-methyltransferase (adenine-specific)